jgi:AcrR family transcriptional regulator
MTASRAQEAYRQVRKEEILDAAMGVMAERGGDVSLNEIAEAAGLTRSALYRYFPNKEQLTREVFTRCFAVSKLILEEAFEQSGSPIQALRSLVERSASGYHREGAREGMILNLQAVLATAMGRAESETPVINLDMINSAKRLAQQAKERRELRNDIDPLGVALLLLSALQGLQLLIAMFGDDIDSDAVTDALLSAMTALQPDVPASS